MTDSESDRIDELRRLCDEDPGREDVLQLVKLLAVAPESRPEAREWCFRALSRSTRNRRVRLELARLFYLDGLGEFCVRELVELRKYGESPSLDKLIAAFGDFVKPFAVMPTTQTQRIPAQPSTVPKAEEILASLDLDADFADALADLSEDK